VIGLPQDPRSSASSWLGTYEIFQYAPFVEMLARHTGRRLVTVGGAIGLLSRKPGLGNMTLSVYHWTETDGDQMLLLERDARNLCSARLWVNTVVEQASFAHRPVEKLHTLTLDLTRTEHYLWDQIGSNSRRKVRRCVKDGVTVTRAASEADFDGWWRIYSHTAETKFFYRQPLALVREVCAQERLSTLLVAKRRGTVIGGMLFLTHSYPVYWLGGFDRESRTYTGHLNLWEALLYFRHQGYSVIDLGGYEADRAHGPSNFKRSFNGSLRSTYAYDIPLSPIRSSLLYAAEAMLGALRRR